MARLRYLLGILATLFLLSIPSSVIGQSNPGFVTGQVPSAALWNSIFAGKQDVIPFGTGVLGALQLPVSGTGGSICLTIGSTCGGSGGSPAFNNILTGTNNSATMIVDTGASLTATNSGVITATGVPVGGISGLGTGVGSALTAAVSGTGSICLTVGSGCAGTFASITSGTNTTAAMVLGTGGTLSYTGSGVINANEITGTALSMGTLVNGDACTVNTGTPNVINCNTVIVGGGNVSTSGSITTNGFAYWAGSTGLASTAAPTNGQLLCGYTSNAPVLCNLASTSLNLVVTNGTGTISLATTAPVTNYTANHNVVTGDNGGLQTYSKTSAISSVLPQAGSAGFLNGWSYCPENTNTGALTVSTTTSTFNGAGSSSLFVPSYVMTCLASDGTNWQALIGVPPYPNDVTKVLTGLGTWVTGGTVQTITAGTNITLSSGSTCTVTCTINAAGSGTVNSGTAGDIAYYATTTTAVSQSSAVTTSATTVTGYLDVTPVTISSNCTLANNNTGCAASTDANGDCGKKFLVSAAATISISSTFPAGCYVRIEQTGTGVVTIAAGTGTLHFSTSFSALTTKSKYAEVFVDGEATGVATFGGDGV